MAIADATAFISKWGAQAQVLGWTAAELFGLADVPDLPAANYSRLARLDHMGLVWLLRNRQVVALTATEAVILCHSGATLKFCRSTEAASAEITKVTPATAIDDVAQIGKPAPVRTIDALAITTQEPTGGPQEAISAGSRKSGTGESQGRARRSADDQRVHVDGSDALGHRTDGLLTTAVPP